MTDNELTAFLFQLAQKIRKETNGKYNPTQFCEMLHQKGGVATAKYLINKNKPSKGYCKLWDLELLELTVEAQILENTETHNLFTQDELEACRMRLKEYGYKLKD